MYQFPMPCINPNYDNEFRSPVTPVMGGRLARAYIINQPFIGLLSLEKGLKKGTIFPNLVIPFPENEKY